MLKYLLRKEFRQIKRNPFIPRMIVGFPLMVLLVLPWAANYEIKNLNISIVDNDKSSFSRDLTQKITASGYFKLTDISSSYDEAIKSVESNKADIILQIPVDFEKKIINRDAGKLMISADAVNGMKGGVAMTYLSSIIADYNVNLIKELVPVGAVNMGNVGSIQIDQQFRFNRDLNYQVYMVPALLVMILTLLCGFLPAISIVFEKELGTMEQMNVSPVSRTTFILGKLIPFWLVGFFVINVGFLVAWLVYGLIPAGHYYHIYIFGIIYILAISGLGLIISNIAHTLQQAMFLIFFFMLIFIMLSGLYTSVDSMPEWAKWIAAFNPLKYLMEVMRSIFLKGSDLVQLWKELVALIGFAVVFNLIAVLSYRKTN